MRENGESRMYIPVLFLRSLTQEQRCERKRQVTEV